eukprot:TRINITY_DN8417_c0_g1_i1.p1 TRINITY_DN8417_c0_g1~~TRINITY_DN8417_c0_g1_i1.p1  ORF type:complete len:244 (-),score=68.46 TRINITY_DN8417_c0_g1_i1:11-742(-)
MLSGKICLVAGGTGIVGNGIVKALLNGGATVIVPSRSESSANKLKSFIGDNKNLFIKDTDMATEKGILELKSNILQQFGGIDHVVSTLGSNEPEWHKLPFSKQPLENLNASIQNLAFPHFLVAKTFIPEIANKQNSTYIFISGASGEGVHSWPSAAILGVGSSALFGIANGFRAEYTKSPVRILEYRIAIRVVDDDKVSQPWENPTTPVGQAVLKLIESNLRDTIVRLRDQKDLKNHVEGNFQ